MKAAIVVKAGQAPVFGEFRNPMAVEGKSVIRVTASSISHITKMRASGTHYSSTAEFPLVPGIDGTGIKENGERVYFLMPTNPFGGMAEFTVVDNANLISLPDGLSDETAAAMAIPGMSSWAALIERAEFVVGETVLINGANGTSGRLAIQIAKHLGAKRIIATGRNTNSFGELRQLGADDTIELVSDRDTLEESFKKEFAQGVDIVLDYLWGMSAELLLIAAAKSGPDEVATRFVQIGSMSGADITLPSAVLRSSPLKMMGSGLGSIPFSNMKQAIHGVLQAAAAKGFQIATEVMSLSDVTTAWTNADTDSRIVLVP